MKQDLDIKIVLSLLHLRVFNLNFIFDTKVIYFLSLIFIGKSIGKKPIILFVF